MWRKKIASRLSASSSVTFVNVCPGARTGRTNWRLPRSAESWAIDRVAAVIVELALHPCQRLQQNELVPKASRGAWLRHHFTARCGFPSTHHTNANPRSHQSQTKCSTPNVKQTALGWLLSAYTSRPITRGSSALAAFAQQNGRSTLSLAQSWYPASDQSVAWMKPLQYSSSPEKTSPHVPRKLTPYARIGSTINCLRLLKHQDPEG